MLDDIFPLIGAGVALYYGALFARDFIKKRNRASWPSLDVTVQRGQVGRGGPGQDAGGVYRSVLGYIYTVGSNPYVGTFVLVVYSEGRADELQRKLNGVRIKIRYNPDSPETSVVESLPGEFASLEVKQSPDWVNYDGGEIIDLNL